MKKALKIIGIILLVILIVGFIFYRTLLPTYDGSFDITYIDEEVTVYYDDYGIPHIYANNEEDAFTALGFVHAQDRLWQMELLRRIAPARLSEVFGEAVTDTDRFFAGIGIDEASEKTVQSLDKNSKSYKLAQAYVNGINQFIEHGATPIEFYLTGIDKTEFSMKDVHNVFGYMAFSFAMAHKTDPLLTSIQQKLGAEYLVDLGMEIDPKSTLLYNHPKKEKDTTQVAEMMVTAVEKALKPLPVPQFIGSNSWVIAPQKTATGKVLFANGPHIAFAQPSVWYEAHVHTPTYEMYGYHLAGIPFPILGHNRNIAYGMTMFQNDDLDFYWEENNPANAAQYKTATGYKDYEVVTKTIKVKDGDDVEVTVKRSQHGPIVNGIADGVDFEKSVAMSWIYTQRKNELLESCYIMSHAKNKEEFEQCLPKIHAPGLNIMYGDVDDNIGWYASAQLVEYPSHVNTKLILDGASGKDEIVRDLKTSENPRATNPPWNYVYSANNQPDSINGGFYPGYYLPENRGKRIVELIEANNQWSKEDMMEMLLDVTSKVHVEAIQEVLKTLEGSPLTEREKEAIEILKNWNGDNQVTDIAPTIYHGFIYQYIKNTFADELDEAGFEMFLKTHVFKRLEVPLLYKESIWYDDVNTTGTETRVFILQKSFKETIEKLESRFGANINDWTWNKVHTLEHQHPIGKIEMLRSYFNVGPFEIAGTREVINNLGYLYDESGNYDVLFGPSTRRVVDFSDVENSMSILPTGQSGNPFSEHYDDQAEMYVQGKFRKMMMNTEEIKKTAKNVLTLE